ncbi:hypothetical protein VaNZ11_010314, partial [Volvox africanus]
SDAARALIKAVADALDKTPPQDPEAARVNTERREIYKRKYALSRNWPPGERQGLNMVLPTEVVGGEAVPVYGHVAGAAPGATFQDRGELYVSGVHATLMKGIHAPSAKSSDLSRGAYSIVLSGQYADDDDMGESFWYTGEGGMDPKSKRQVKDQSMERGANAALRRNCLSRTPVRVIRGFLREVPEGGAAAPVAQAGDGAGGYESGGGDSNTMKDKKPKKEKGFVYEGLYVVLEFKEEPSKDGPKVCKFLLHGVPKHSTVNTKVEYGIFGGAPSTGRLHARRLAAADTSPSRPLAKRPRLDKIGKARMAMVEEIRQTYSSDVLLMEDITRGLEPVPIPLVNEFNSETLAPDFKYIKEYEWAPGVYDLVRPVLRFIDEEMAEFARGHIQCGLAFNRLMAARDAAMGAKLPAGYTPHSEEQYNSAGCLLITDPCGVHECGPACTSAKCNRNKRVVNGVVLPLEVFMTESKGWGVRCRQHIPAGAFVCTYVGQVMTDRMAELRKGVDHYLFNLDYFTHIYEEMQEKGIEAIAAEIPLHKIPPVVPVSTIRKLQELAAEEVRCAFAKVADATAAGAAVNAPNVSDADGDGDENSSTGFFSEVLPPAAVKAAARELLYSCRAVLLGIPPAGGEEEIPYPHPREAAAKDATGIQPPSSIAAEAEAALAVCDKDPGAFYLQSIFGTVPVCNGGSGGNSTSSAVPGVAAADPASSRMGLEQPEEYGPILVLDARCTGNVGRFINHSCEGNLAIQAVFSGYYRNTFCYHVGLFAGMDIPAMTELTYNYGYHSQAGRGEVGYGMECHCGATSCVGKLL